MRTVADDDATYLFTANGQLRKMLGQRGDDQLLRGAISFRLRIVTTLQQHQCGKTATPETAERTILFQRYRGRCQTSARLE